MMTTLKERRLYQQLILSRSKNPRHFGVTNPIHRTQGLTNPYCGDAIEVTLTIDENSVIEDIKFTGSGCALCLASADLMAETVKGRTIDETKDLVEHFHQVMLGETELDSSFNLLKAIAGAKRYPIKVKCVTLPWHTLKLAV
ncbi:SUF system NifU family Fe-S cluster assembly protein [Pleurocapsales cyanobacterium LEGE 10410]|nr:SUF system NifU family Fe-S cluster assembly protein [Pleurocapsales cyanobacterium LEGE 10410]